MPNNKTGNKSIVKHGKGRLKTRSDDLLADYLSKPDIVDIQISLGSI